MRIELEQKLKDKYPMLMADLLNPDVTMQYSCMFWGIECGDGWFDLIDELCSKLEQMNVELASSGAGYIKCSQVKEKYGTLRFYVCGDYPDSTYDLISEYEDKSGHVCENCGAPAKTEGGFWLTTLCTACKR